MHLGAQFSGSGFLVGRLQGRIFSGLEGAWLCLMNSGAALAPWGAVFTCLGAQRAAFLRFRECLVVVAKFRGGLHLGKSLFKSRGRLDGAAGFRGRHLFTFSWRLVAAELKDQHFL